MADLDDVYLLLKEVSRKLDSLCNITLKKSKNPDLYDANGKSWKGLACEYKRKFEKLSGPKE